MKKTRSKRSKLWNLDTEYLKMIVAQSFNISDLMRHLNLPTAGRNFDTIQRILVEREIDFSKLLGKSKSKFNPRFFESKYQIQLSEILVENSTYSRGSLKRRLIQEGLLEEKCNNCNLTPFWDNKRLVLIIDHINGKPKDNRLENLRLLCPNCNSQTDTFAGRNNNTHNKKARERDNAKIKDIKRAASKKTLQQSIKSLQNIISEIEEDQKTAISQCLTCNSDIKTGIKYCSEKCRGIACRKFNWDNIDLVGIYEEENRNMLALCRRVLNEYGIKISDVGLKKNLKKQQAKKENTA